MLRCAASLSGFSRSLQRVGRVVRLPGRCDAIKWMMTVQERSLGWFACALHARAGSDSCTAARLDVGSARCGRCSSGIGLYITRRRLSSREVLSSDCFALHPAQSEGGTSACVRAKSHVGFALVCEAVGRVAHNRVWTCPLRREWGRRKTLAVLHLSGRQARVFF